MPTMLVLCLYNALTMATMPTMPLLCLLYLYYACNMPTIPVLCLLYLYYVCTMPTMLTMPIYNYRSRSDPKLRLISKKKVFTSPVNRIMSQSAICCHKISLLTIYIHQTPLHIRNQYTEIRNKYC